jgi:hypothetical protein
MPTGGDAEAFGHLIGILRDRENVILDFSDELQYRAALALHTLGGHTPLTRPGMYAALAERRERHLAQGGIGDEKLPQDAPYQTGAQVNDISRVVNTLNAGASGFSTVVGGALQLNSTITVMNPQGTTTLAAGSGSQYNQGQYLALSAKPVTGQNAQTQMVGTILYSYQKVTGGPWTTAATQRSVGVGILADPVVAHPNKHQTVIATQYIRIALGRGQNTQTDVDYWYWYGTGTTNYALPWNGYIDFTAAPQTLQYGVNPQIFGTLARGPGGNGGFAPLPDASAKNLFDNLTVSGTRLSWLLAPPVEQPPWNNMGNPLTWGNLNWQSGEADYVTVQLVVNLQGQTIPATATVQSSLDPDIELDGSTNIPPIQFLWSCLVEGTPVLLADGSTLPIEQVVRGTVVRCGDGVDRPVSSTTIFRFDGDVLRLRTEGGHEVALSGNHPVVTTDGLVQAHQLVEGTELRVHGARSKVAVARFEHHAGLLCNLRFDESANPDPATSTFFAGGVEVGDYALQLSHDLARRTDPERITALLEPRYLPDFENYQREIAADR